MFRDKVVWITGASSGIGAALAREFANAGASLVLTGRREEELLRVRGALLNLGIAESSVFVHELDVTDHAAIPGVLEAVLGHFGHIDMLINNAGISQRSLCQDTDMRVYRRLFEVNVMGPIALTQAVLPHMLARKSGHIVATASVAGKVAAPYRSGYSATKHAVIGFFDSLRAEVADQGIKVTTIIPGFVRTNISVNALRGDGTTFGLLDGNIAGGMDVSDCAWCIMRGFYKNKPEIPVGYGKEMHMLWIKRLFPRLANYISRKLAAPHFHTAK